MQESKNFCSNYLTKFSVDLNGIWYAVDERHTHCILFIQYLRREPYACDFVIKPLMLAYIQTFKDQCL